MSIEDGIHIRTGGKIPFFLRRGELTPSILFQKTKTKNTYSVIERPCICLLRLEAASYRRGGKQSHTLALFCHCEGASFPIVPMAIALISSHTKQSEPILRQAESH